MPNGDWPGSEYHPLIAVHWEVIIRIKRDSGGPLLFVKPLLLKHDGRDCIIEDMPTIILGAVNWRTVDVLYRTRMSMRRIGSRHCANIADAIIRLFGSSGMRRLPQIRLKYHSNHVG